MFGLGADALQVFRVPELSMQDEVQLMGTQDGWPEHRCPYFRLGASMDLAKH